MIKPPYLQAGDKIGIVAPGRKVKREEVDEAQKILTNWGLKVECGKNLFSDEHSYLSASDNNRLADLQTMLNDPSIKAIICARGGYGTTRILDLVDFKKFEQSPKWVVGFSDITALHLKLFKKGFESLHAIMPILFSKSDSSQSVEALRKILFGEPLALEAGPCTHNKTGKATGYLVGGNLSLVIDSLGTSNEVDTAGNILMIEEIDEYRYKIDRMLVQLKRAGKLAHLAGLVIGHFTDIKNSTLAFDETVEEMILHHTREFNFPVGFKFPVGHENPNLPFIHGLKMALSIDENGSVLKPDRNA